jgi:inner membrane protein
LREDARVPTIVSHAIVAAGGAHYLPELPGRGRARWLSLRVLGYLAMLPDADVVGFRFGVAYESGLGHRGLSHSLAFAAVSSAVGAAVIAWRTQATAWSRRLALYAMCFVAAATHPLLDMLTDGGYGCALFAPVSWERLFFPWTPIPVSPIGLHWRVAPVLATEAAMLWPVPLASIVLRRWPAARWRWAFLAACFVAQGAAIYALGSGG